MFTNSVGSEIVIPIIVRHELVGVLDIDSPYFNRFTAYDQKFLESIVDIIAKEIFEKVMPKKEVHRI